LLKVRDAESGYEQYIDTGSKKLRDLHQRNWNNRQASLHEVFTKSNVDNVSIATDEDYVKQLMMLFRKRN
jgi:hypothetical protein